MKTLLLVGCGKMGSAMLARWQRTPAFSGTRFAVIEPAEKFSDTDDVLWATDLESLPAMLAPDVVVFAIKPQMFDDVLPAYQERFGDKPLYISIAAGITLGSLTLHLGQNAQIVRAMPNTPALIGASMTVLCAGAAITPESKHIATELMQAIGEVTWIHKESLMDAVTAVSGSGPAYVFLFLESLTEAGIKAGLSAEMARMLAIHTVMGSCQLAEKSGADFGALRERVTSPGGTTEAALRVLLQDDRFKRLLMDAVMKAAERSCELASDDR